MPSSYPPPSGIGVVDGLGLGHGTANIGVGAGGGIGGIGDGPQSQQPDKQQQERGQASQQHQQHLQHSQELQPVRDIPANHPHHDQNESNDLPSASSVSPTTVAAAQHSLHVLQEASEAAAAAIAAAAANSTSAPSTSSSTAPSALPEGITFQHYHTLAPSPNTVDHQQHQYPSPPVAPSPPRAPTVNGPATKATRLRRACDICSARKVKCDEFGPPCNPCKALGVECTWAREMKRRGPPNKHAEAAKAKRARLELEAQAAPATSGAAASETAETLVSIAGASSSSTSDLNSNSNNNVSDRNAPHQQLDAEAIAPWPTLALLVDDFYTYIHPLIPFPHEPSFRRSFVNREDKTNPEFLALLAGMIGCLVASFPRAARLHLKSQQNASLFPRASIMIERCRTVALQARGPLFNAKEAMTIHDAATSYFLGLSAAYTMQWKLCRRFLAECLSFTRELGFHRSRRLDVIMGSLGVEHMPHKQPLNHIDDQIGKRIFWVMLVGVRSMAQLGASHSELAIPSPTAADPYPDLPLEVDDEFITPTEILPQPPGVVSMLTGFNQGIKIYMTMNPIVGVELSYGINSLPLEQQEEMLASCLHAVNHVTDDLPRELQLNLDQMQNGSGGDSTPYGMRLGISIHCPPPVSAEAFEDAPGFQYFPPAYPEQQPANDLRHVIENQPERRRLLQFEIQKSNIYISQLATRSYYVERCFSLRDAHRARLGIPLGMKFTNSIKTDASPAATAATASSSLDHVGSGPGYGSVIYRSGPAGYGSMASKTDQWAVERELIVQHLLVVLASIPQRNMEPNGSSLIHKIRQVASTLLNDSPERKGPLAVKSEATLSHFLNILMRLEKTGPGRGDRTASAAAGNNNGPLASGVMTPLDEEEELRSWADLRETQMRFLHNGAFIGSI